MKFYNFKNIIYIFIKYFRKTAIYSSEESDSPIEEETNFNLAKAKKFRPLNNKIIGNCAGIILQSYNNF